MFREPSYILMERKEVCLRENVGFAVVVVLGWAAEVKFVDTPKTALQFVQNMIVTVVRNLKRAQ
jgi:hypothetical protein